MTPGMVSGRSGRPLARARASRPTGRLDLRRGAFSPARRPAARRTWVDRRAGRRERPVRVARREGYRDGRGWCAGSGLTSIETAWVAVSRGCEWRWGPSDRDSATLRRSTCRSRALRHHGGRRRLRVTHGAKFHLAFGHLAFGLESFSSSIFFPQESHFRARVIQRASPGRRPRRSGRPGLPPPFGGPPRAASRARRYPAPPRRSAPRASSPRWRMPRATPSHSRRRSDPADPRERRCSRCS